ncbi:MAG: Ger(x)C family spore germination protein [Bacillota bacterium]
MRRAISVGLVLCLSILNGCYGSLETDELAYVLAIGVDEVKDDLIKLTIQIANPRRIGGGDQGAMGQRKDGGGQEASVVFSVEASTIFGGIDLLESVIDRQLSLMHAKAIIFSEKTARKGLKRFIHAFRRYREFRATVLVFVSRGEAGEFLQKNSPLLEANPSKQFELTQLTQTTTGMIPYQQFTHFYNSMKTHGRQAICTLVDINKQEEKKQQERQKQQEGMNGTQAGGSGEDQDGPPKEQGQQEQQEGETQKEGQKQKKKRPEYRNEGIHIAGTIPREGGNPAEFLGAAVFRADKMAGTLDGEETRVMQMVRGEFRRTMLSIKDPRRPAYMIVLDLRQSKPPAVEIKLAGGRPRIETIVNLEFDYVAIQSGEDYQRLGKYAIVEKAVVKYLSRICRQIIGKSKKWRSDFLGFGEYAATQFWTWDEWIKFDWHKQFAQASIKVRFNARLRRVGIIQSSSKITR